MIFRRGIIRLAVVAVACLAPVLFPGDAPWINDEPKLISSALELNAQHQWAEYGLEGTHGFRYGPLPTWLYQIYLRLSHDLVALVAVRGLLVALGAVTGLLWLSDALKVPECFVLPFVLSPYLWLYARILWDNTFNIPLCAIAFGAYARFLVEERRWQLLVAVACAALMPMIHLMALAFVIPIAAHAFLFRRGVLWQNRLWIGTTLLPLIVLWIPYARIVWSTHAGAGGESGPEGWWFPLLAGRYFSGWGLEYFFEDGWRGSGGMAPVLLAATAISCVSFVAVWAGIVVAGRDVFRSVRNRTPPDLVVAAAGMVLLGQLLVDGLTGAFGHPHYYNATWIAYAALVLAALRAISKPRIATAIVVVSAGAVSVVLISCIVGMHLRGGTRGDHYGPTLANQLTIARELEQYPKQSRLETNVPHYLRFPHGLRTLITLDGPVVPARPSAWLAIRYASTDPRDGHVVLEQMGDR